MGDPQSINDVHLQHTYDTTQIIVQSTFGASKQINYIGEHQQRKNIFEFEKCSYIF